MRDENWREEWKDAKTDEQYLQLITMQGSVDTNAKKTYNLQV